MCVSVMLSILTFITMRIYKTIKLSEGYELLAEKTYNVTTRKRGVKRAVNNNKDFQKCSSIRVSSRHLTLRITLESRSIRRVSQL